MVSGIKSAELKLIRAKKHLRAIKRYVAKYSASQPHRITAKTKGKTKLNIHKAPPREIAILAGEMIYQMRSALDHLAFDLVQRNPNVATVDPKWREHCQFPLRTKLSNNRPPPGTRADFGGDVPGISSDAFAVIEGMQPYRSSAIYTTNGCLRALVILSNIDKHRRLNLIRPRIRQKQYVRYGSGARYGSWKILDRGAKVEPPHHEGESGGPVYVNRRYTALVTFDERDSLGEATNSVPLDILLDLILYQIEVFIIPAFRQLLK